jgi:general secretion pathway protein A
VLIIDEAQHLSPEVLEEIRILSNLETNDQKLLQIVIVGQLNLLDVLQKAELRQLDQRISIRCSLKPLTREEVEAYVTHRLWVARGSTSVSFTPRAFDLVHSLTSGVPRMINLLCDRSLMVACEAQTGRITENHIVKAAAQLNLDVPRNKIRGERPISTPESRRRRIGLVAAIVLAALAGTTFYLVGNPLELLAPDGPLPSVRDAAVPAMPEKLTPIASPITTDAPPPQPGSFSILVGTFDSMKKVATVDAALRSKGLPLYTVDVLVAPGDVQRRVLIGRYATRQEAEAACATVKTQITDARVIPGEAERLRVVP